MNSLLLKNAVILQGRDFIPVKGYLGIRGKYIDYIGSEKPAQPYAREKDMRGAIVLPGLVNCHTHAVMVLLRGLGSDLPLDQWLWDAITPAEDRLTEETALAGVALAQLEMLASGTTSYSDMYNFTAPTAAYTAPTGIKANLCRPVLSFDPDEKPADNFRFREALELWDGFRDAGDGRIRIDFCLHAEYTNLSPAVTAAAAQACMERGSRMHVHLSETKKEHEECRARHGLTPAAYLAGLGVFDSPALAAHCVWLEPEDIELFSRKKVYPVHNPSSNLKLGSGIAPIREFRKKGLAVTLGTDGAASNNCLNMFQEMHLAALLAKGSACDAAAVTARDILAMATWQGAAAQGRTDTGVLEPGKCADICAVSVQGLHLFPVLDPVDTLVYAAQGSDVCLTASDGQVLYEDGEFPTLDREKILADARAASRYLLQN